MYRLIFYQSKALGKDRKRLMKDKKTLGLIEEALGKLAVNPFAAFLSVKRLHNLEEATFRLRCGKWRVLFDVDTQNKVIIIYRIKQRKEGY
ncbi:MAG: type II toxin-antitoxin system RelE/ParE family toxin [Patescibacteria group bacterium]